MTNILRRIRILPLLIVVAGLSFSIRVGEFAVELKSMGSAHAQQEVNAEAPPLPARPNVEKKTEAPVAEAEEDAEAEPIMTTSDLAAEKARADGELSGPSILDLADEDINWRDATESEYEYSEVQQDVYKELATRRDNLDARERALARQAALLEAAERELDQKLRELTSIQREIEGLLRQQSAEEKARIQSLVKIYEGMKAKDAARIFNTLDVDVLLNVISRMSERKSAPILAEMDADRARTVTILLAQQRQVPGMSP
jgi:flagellar motility protein MotE (MotC chaperone)